MFFTQEDYRKIEKWLLANSRKDTEFAGAATPLTGAETISFVQDGYNVKVLLNDLIKQLFLLGVSDFLNITDKYGESYITLPQAISLIPYKSRKTGQVITFLNEEGKWVIYQFRGTAKNQWNNLTLWIDSDSFKSNKKAGTTAERPILTLNEAGFIYFDKTLSKCICWSGTGWVNMDGTALI